MICSRESERPAALLAGALGSDMHDWSKPTASGYFVHFSKPKALEAVQVFAPDQITRLARLEKGDLASEAERLGAGWQPKVSHVRRYKLQNISLERLMQALVSLDQRVEIIVRPARRAHGAGITVAA